MKLADSKRDAASGKIKLYGRCKTNNTNLNWLRDTERPVKKFPKESEVSEPLAE